MSQSSTAVSEKMADAAKVSPESYTVLFENDRVRVLEIRIKPGAKVAMHSHPAYVAYYLSTAKAKLTSPDGKSEEREFKAGDVEWHDAESHEAVNTGNTEVHIIAVELKI